MSLVIVKKVVFPMVLGLLLIYLWILSVNGMDYTSLQNCEKNSDMRIKEKGSNKNYLKTDFVLICILLSNIILDRYIMNIYLKLLNMYTCLWCSSIICFSYIVLLLIKRGYVYIIMKSPLPMTKKNLKKVSKEKNNLS